MARASHPIRLALVLVGGLAAAGAACAGGPAGDPAKKAGSTFNLVTVQATGARVSAPSAGASLAPKTVVSNPYNVPLLQNAGTLHFGR